MISPVRSSIYSFRCLYQVSDFLLHFILLKSLKRSLDVNQLQAAILEISGLSGHKINHHFKAFLGDVM